MTPQSFQAEKPGAYSSETLNFDLVFSRLEKEILEGRKLDLCLQVIQREQIWKSAAPEKQLRWARLAQMAGDAENALNVLAHINNEKPELKSAWQERLEILFILQQHEDLGSVLQKAKKLFGDEQHGEWFRAFAAKGDFTDRAMDAAAVPFERLRHRQDLIRHFMELFSGRKDCFARQWVDKTEGKQGYVPVRRPMEHQDVEEHLGGRKTYGIYLVRYEGSVNLAVMDADLKQEYRGRKLKGDEAALVKREGAYLNSRIAELSAEMGLQPLVEFSGGKGLHFWFFLKLPVPPSTAKRALDTIRVVLAKDLRAFNMEVFPKQEQLSGKGLGNLVKLPLGVHRLTGKRSYFIACHDRSVEAQLDFLRGVEPSEVEDLRRFVEAEKREKVLPHPRLQKWSGDFPELSKIEVCCPPLGQIIASCRQGRGLTTTEERVLFQTIGFLKRAKTLVHHLCAFLPEYNPHLVDFKLSKLRGGPLGCKRIHSILGFTGDMCTFQEKDDYDHPLLHLGVREKEEAVKAERADSLASALENLKTAISQVQRCLR